MISRRFRVRASLLVLLLTVLTVGPLSPAWSETTFTVSGVVSTNLGPIHDAETNQVLVWDNYGDIVADPSIAADGSYTVQLPAGTYSFCTTQPSVILSTATTSRISRRLAVTSRSWGTAAWTSSTTNPSFWCTYETLTASSLPAGSSSTVATTSTTGRPGTAAIRLSSCTPRTPTPAAPATSRCTAIPRCRGSGDEGCELTVYPADGTWQYFDITLSDPVTNDITVNIPDAVTVQGHIATPRGDSTNWSVLATNAQGRPVAGPTTFPAGGDYTMRLSPGTYTLEFNASSDDEWMVLRKSVTVVGNATVDGETEGRPGHGASRRLPGESGDGPRGAAVLGVPPRTQQCLQLPDLEGFRDRPGHVARGAGVGHVEALPPWVHRRGGQRLRVLGRGQPDHGQAHRRERVHPGHP